MSHTLDVVRTRRRITGAAIAVIATTAGLGISQAALAAPASDRIVPPRVAVPAKPGELPHTTPAPVPSAGQSPGHRSAHRRDTDWRALIARARNDGRIPVIVSLDTSNGLLGQRKVAALTDALLAALAKTDVTHVKDFRPAPFLALHATPAALAVLRLATGVLDVREDRERALSGSRATPATAPDNPALEPFWNLRATQTPMAWDEGYDGRGQTVAILDSGVTTRHPWMRGWVSAEACFATTKVGSRGGACPNGKWWQMGRGAARPCKVNQCDHGTHVAGIAAGRYGVARGARIVAVQVFQPGLDEQGQPVAVSTDSDIAWGLKYVLESAARQPIAAVNLSLGSPAPSEQFCDQDRQIMDAAIDYFIRALRQAGVAVVIASGNSGSFAGVETPACHSAAVSVGATTLDPSGADAVWEFSSSGPTLSLLAPGTGIWSAVPYGGVKTGIGRVARFNGTSMAAPHVAGVFAVLRQVSPAATVDQLVGAVQASGPAVLDTRNNVARARLDVWNAVVQLYNTIQPAGRA